MEGVRQHFCCAHYDECIGSLKDYQPPPDAAMSQKVIRAIAETVGQYLELMAQQVSSPRTTSMGSQPTLPFAWEAVARTAARAPWVSRIIT